MNESQTNLGDSAALVRGQGVPLHVAVRHLEDAVELEDESQRNAQSPLEQGVRTLLDESSSGEKMRNDVGFLLIVSAKWR